MSVAPTAYRLQEADVAKDRERILGLWRSGLAQEGRPEAKYDWYYAGHLEGAPRVFFLKVADEAGPAGSATLARRRMRLGTRALVGGFLADFVVTDAHRSFFPAHFLQKSIRAEALRAFGVVFGMPNPQSEAVVRRAGYRRVAEAVRYARVLRAAPFLERYVPAWVAGGAAPVLDHARHLALGLPGRGAGLVATWSHAVPAGLDALWERAALDGVLMGARDSAFLDWRFARCPLHRYRFVSIATRTGRLVAYAVLQEGSELAEVADFLVDPAMPAAAARLWREVARGAWATGTASVSVEFSGPPAVVETLRTAGWVERERRGVYAATAEGAGIDPAHWYLTAADEDA